MNDPLHKRGMSLAIDDRGSVRLWRCGMYSPSTKPSPFMIRPPRRGFTLIELLVTIAIIGVMIGMLMPGLQSMREQGRRSLCQQNLAQLSLAIAAYHDRYDQLPVGTVADRHGWLVRLLEQLDAAVVAKRVDWSAGITDPANEAVRSVQPPMLRCPSEIAVSEPMSSYAGIVGSRERAIDENGNGCFVLNRTIRYRDITDGLSGTLLVGEKLSHPSDELGWFSGTRSTLRNTAAGIASKPLRPDGLFKPADLIGRELANGEDPALIVGSLGSHHAGGAQLLFASGEIRFVDASMDQRTLAQMADRADGQVPLDWQTPR